ncbi:MAG: DNA polymerase III subunit alpha [Chloroflexota bacterium]
MSDFCHLHCHSEYSLLDGLGRTADLAKEAARLGQPALALTDHGVMHGVIEFFRNCKKQGVKPIIGVEAYLTPYGRKMTGTDPQKDKARHHLLLLAQNMTGYKNLLKICSDAQLRGYYYRPRIDADYLAAHAEGLICTTGCMAAEIPYLLNPEDGRLPQPDKALERLRWYLEVFGRERFFIELQEHSIPALTQINKTLFRWGQEHNLDFIVTNDVHYVTAQDAQAHDTLLCVQTSSLINQPKRLRLSDHSYYLKSEQEMRDIFRPLADLPESAFTNTLKIAEMCEVDLEDKNFHLPDVFEFANGGSTNGPMGKPAAPRDDAPSTVRLSAHGEAVRRDPSSFAPWLAQIPVELIEAKDYAAALRHLTEKGLVERYGPERAASEEVQKRKEHELNIINRMGFAVYYLIVWDLCEYARQQNIWWNVRGSGAGSIVAYALGITLIDPLRHNLIFERFLNPGRISMPDFDLDYPDDQREPMIEYARRRYGDKRVAQIVSFGRMKARQSIRDVGRAMDIPLTEVDQLAKQIAAIPGKPATIDNALDPEHEFFAPELKQQYDTVDHVRQLVDFARNLEGVARHSSVHAAAVIITDRDLDEYVPVMRAQGSVITESVTQFEFPVCESIGLLKVDFLGLSTLTVMRRAAALIEQRRGLKFNLSNIPMDTPEAFQALPDFPPPEKAFDLLAKGDVTGVFQVEGTGMRRVLTDMKPTRFEHIVAAISLFRPGPMEYIPTYIARMHGKEPVEFKHPRLEPILAETYGIIVYQEQIIRIAAELAGYAPGDADQIRKAVGKKIKEKIEEHRSKFVTGAVENGIAQKTAEAIYGDIEFFARYGFNKAHAADYALVTCQTAYLKAHFPVEYMAALLTVERGNTDKVGMLVGECRAMSIEVLPPSVNHGGIEFVIEDRPATPQAPAIRFSLSAIKNVGEGPIQHIVEARQAGGPFSDIDDFCTRVDLRQVGRKSLEGLIKVGALDCFGAARPHLLAIIDRMVNLSGSTHKAASVGQISMFDLGGFDAPQTGSVLYPVPEIEEVRKRDMLSWEKELVGAYLSDHPIQRYMPLIKAAHTVLLGELDETMHDQQVSVAGLVNSVRHHQTKKGDPMAFVEIEDIQATCEIIVFPRTYEEHKALLVEGNLVLVRGKVDAKDGRSPKILADSLTNEITTYNAVGETPLVPAAGQNGPHHGANGAAQSRRVAESAMPYMPPPPPPAEALPPPPPPPGWLHITLRRTDNLAQDKHLLKTVYNLLAQRSGNDRFSLYIPTGGPKKIRIDFPNQTTQDSAHLRQQLAQLLGATAVRDDQGGC